MNLHRNRFSNHTPRLNAKVSSYAQAQIAAGAFRLQSQADQLAQPRLNPLSDHCWRTFLKMQFASEPVTEYLPVCSWRIAYRSAAEIAVRECAMRGVRGLGAIPPASGVSPNGADLSVNCLEIGQEKGAPDGRFCFYFPWPYCTVLNAVRNTV